MIVNKKRLLLILIVLLTIDVYSQYRNRSKSTFDQGLSVTGKAGTNIFYGDLVDKERFGVSVGVTLDKEIHKYFTLRGQIELGEMQGTQKYQADLSRDYAKFKNFHVELTFGGTYRPLNHFLGYFKERTFQPYVLLQAGFLYFNATEYWCLKEDIEYYNTNIWRTATGFAPVVGLGGGASIWLNPRLKANIEFYGTFALSDKLDAHEDWTMRPNEEDVHVTDNNDFYYIGTVGFTYLINDSRFRNDFRHGRKSYTKNKGFFTKKGKSAAKSYSKKGKKRR